MAYLEDMRAQVDRLTGELHAAKTENTALKAEVKDLRLSKSAEISARAATAERQRCKAILTSPEAEGRRKQAEVFAFESDVSEGLAAQLLAAQPKEQTGPRIPSIAERAAEAESAGFGGDFFADRQTSRDPLAASILAMNKAAQSR